MAIKISGAEYPVKTIFSDEFLFEIPAYQRPYSWTTDEAGALLTDLLDASQASNLENPDPYFLGSLVLAKEEGQPGAKVIDGQQRLTTLTILLAALSCAVDEDQAPQIRTFIRQEANQFAGTHAVMRVTLRQRDASFFRQYVQTATSFDPLLSLDPLQLENDAQRNIQANARLFAESLESLDGAARDNLATFLISDCFLVAVSTPDRDSAYRIFAVLNDRGLDLSHADIIKSEVIGAIPDTTLQDSYTKRWEDIEDELGTEAFKDLFSHIRMIYAREKQRGALLREFREAVLSRVDDPKSFIDDVVAPWGDIYARIRLRSWESTAKADEINRWLAWLGRIDNFDWIPPAISYMHRFENDSERIALFLGRLERLAATMFVRRVGVNDRIARYAAVLNEMDEHGDVLETASALDLSDDEIVETLGRLQGDIYLDGRTRLYVLLRLDSAKSAGGASYEHQVLTVEHVLPQNPNPSSSWVTKFNPKDRTEWTHRLANLVLLTRRKNSAAQNYEFEVKKKKYFSGSDGLSPFLLTMEVLQAADWTPEFLTERQSKLVGVLQDMWQLTPAVAP
jgi:hypothetical protein